MSDVVRLVMKCDCRDDLSIQILLNMLEEYFRKKENNRLRRSQFMSRKQEEGESFTVFYREKVKLFQMPDPCSHCYDRCLTDHLIESLFDANIRRKCRKLPDTAEVEDVVKLCENEEAAKNEESLCQNISISNVQLKSQKNLKKKKCPRCSNPWHKSLRDCPAKMTVCEKCKLRGHFTSCCLTRDVQSVELTSEDSDNLKVGCLHINSVNKRQSLRQINVKIKSVRTNITFEYQANPDTGAEVCVAGVEFMEKLKYSTDKLKHTNIALESADQLKLKILRYDMPLAKTPYQEFADYLAKNHRPVTGPARAETA